jgi:competence protein ComEA
MRALFVIVAVLAMAALPAAAAQQKSPAAKPARASAAPTTPVNINTATQQQLETLPGLGAKVAERIIEYRQKNGNFKKVEEILETPRSGPCLLSI